VEFVANKTDHEFHEFHENDHCHLDVIGLKYNFSQSLHDFLWDTDVHGFDGLTRSRSSRTRSTCWTQHSQIRQVFSHGRDGQGTKSSWHGRLAREWLGSLAIAAKPRIPRKLARIFGQMRNGTWKMTN